MRQPRRNGATIATLTVAAALLVGGCSTSSEENAQQALEAFLTGVPTGELADVAFITAEGTALSAETVTDALAQLREELGDQPPELTADELSVTNNIASAPVSIAWPLPGGATWSYTTEVRLAEHDGQWRVVWTPAVVHPELRDGDTLALRRVPTTRGDILDAHGEPLVTARQVVEVGIWPAEVADLEAELAELGDALQTLGVDLDLVALAGRVGEADADQFVSVITLRRSDYDQVRERIRPLPGTTFREEDRHLAPNRTFARALLGTVDPVTAEDLERNPGAYVVGDHVGHGGLSERYDGQLRGVIGQTVIILRPDPEDADAVEEIELHRIDPVPGDDLATTLDQEVQRAAEAALAEEPNPAALVAIRISDGAVLAVANTEGPAANPVNLAFTGQVPPGSTFKMVTAYGLLRAGEVSVDATVGCPEEFTVEGRTFTNAGGFGLGDVPFVTVMARSCNTSFAQLAPTLGADGLAAAGAELGLGEDWDLGIDTFTGQVATGGSAADRAAAAFGQGTTVVSPVAMAAATATVARGAWLPPALVREPDANDYEAVALPESVVTDLHTALREVVTAGTAEALADVPGEPVYGKTGTAEYEGGSDDHAWFIGWQDDIAFAVFIADGGSGSGAAVPAAGRFLRNL